MDTNDYSAYTILVVDDIPINVKLVQAMLNKYHFNIMTAFSGEEALAKIAENKPNAVLVDLMMPGMSGFELTEKIRNQYSKKELPVIVLSALCAEEHMVTAFQTGVNDFITKPTNSTRLFTAIQKVL